MENIYISNKEELEKKIEKIKKDGAEKLQVVSDFDKTLTKSKIDGQKVSSVISILRDEKYLTEDYSERAKDLFNFYHAFEVNKDMDWSERKNKMLEWWSKHYEVLKECGLSKGDLEAIIKSDRILFRDGYKDFFKALECLEIPLTIITANGLGGDVIKMILERFDIKSNKIHLIANEIIWNETGYFVDVKKPIIHVLNKDEVIIENEKIKENIKDRHNIILLGDSEGDVNMVKNIEFTNIIKIGYLNEKEEELKDKYLKIFDVVITGDGGLDFVNDLLKQIN